MGGRPGSATRLSVLRPARPGKSVARDWSGLSRHRAAVSTGGRRGGTVFVSPASPWWLAISRWVRLLARCSTASDTRYDQAQNNRRRLTGPPPGSFREGRGRRATSEASELCCPLCTDSARTGLAASRPFVLGPVCADSRELGSSLDPLGAGPGRLSCELFPVPLETKC